MRMRIKNFTLLFLMGFFGLFTTNLFAQDDATIAPENIYYWIGEGQNEVIFIGNWNEPDTALAWGYRFNEETLTVKDVLDAITEADYRLSYEANGSWFSNLVFNDGVVDLSLYGGYWMYNINGQTAGNYFDAQTVVNGDVIKFGDESCGIITDPNLWTYVWTTPVVPVYALAEEAMINASEILYWIGEGEHQAIFAVNWAEPNVCYAWGYRFSGDSVILENMMDDIAAADGRFDYKAEGGMVLDLMFIDGDQHLALAGMWWMYNINGYMAWYGYNEQAVYDGDFVKFGDESCGTYIAPWTQVWEAPVVPVPVYDNVNENSVNMSLYPNPASTYTMLEVDMSNATVTVADLQGRVLRSFAVVNATEPVRIETEGFKAGLYFVTVSNGSNSHTLKLSVK